MIRRVILAVVALALLAVFGVMWSKRAADEEMLHKARMDTIRAEAVAGRAELERKSIQRQIDYQKRLLAE